MNVKKEFPKEFYNKLQEYFKNPKFVEILQKLGIDANYESIEEYISNELFGSVRGEFAINRFFNRDR